MPGLLAFYSIIQRIRLRMGIAFSPCTPRQLMSQCTQAPAWLGSPIFTMRFIVRMFTTPNLFACDLLLIFHCGKICVRAELPQARIPADGGMVLHSLCLCRLWQRSTVHTYSIFSQRNLEVGQLWTCLGLPYVVNEGECMLT